MNKKVFGKALLFALITVVLMSCNKDESESFQVISDVFMVNQIMDDDTVHALTFYVYGNMEMATAEVMRDSDHDDRMQMVALDNSGLLMALEPVDDDFETEIDTATLYYFSVTSESGVTVEDFDFYNPHNLAIPNITDIRLSTQDKIIVEWDDVEEAQSYLVKVDNAEGENIFISDGLISTVNQLILDNNNGHWKEQPESGETYSVQVHALLYENGANSYNAPYNIQEVSIGREPIIWGE